jgi:hypothetical protein
VSNGGIVAVVAVGICTAFLAPTGDEASSGVSLPVASRIGKTSGTFDPTIDILLSPRTSAVSFLENCCRPPRGKEKW